MSVRRLAAVQPDGFAFTDASEGEIAFWLAKYPAGKQASAVLPMLWIAQKQEGWVSEPAIRCAESSARRRVKVRGATYDSSGRATPADRALASTRRSGE